LSATAHLTDFDEWMERTFHSFGSFTMLIVLVGIDETTVTPLRSSYLHVIGDETRWPEMARLFDASGAAWDGAAMFQADRSGLVADPIAKRRLAELTRHIERDRTILNQGAFFDRRGLSLKLEEIGTH
jgi:hypothetical protein